MSTQSTSSAVQAGAAAAAGRRTGRPAASRPIALYAGGIQFLVQSAIAADGSHYQRFQERSPHSYRWTRWRRIGAVNVESLPGIIECGFSALRRVYRDRLGVRLPA